MLYDSRNENFRIAFHADRITNNQHRTHITLFINTYFRRQHGQICLDADDRVARFSRQSSQSARQLRQNMRLHLFSEWRLNTHRQGQQMICRGSTVQITQFRLESANPSLSSADPNIALRSSMIFDQSSNTVSRSGDAVSPPLTSREYRRRVSGEAAVSVI